MQAVKACDVCVCAGANWVAIPKARMNLPRRITGIVSAAPEATKGQGAPEEFKAKQNLQTIFSRQFYKLGGTMHLFSHLCYLTSSPFGLHCTSVPFLAFALRVGREHGRRTLGQCLSCGMLKRVDINATREFVKYKLQLPFVFHKSRHHFVFYKLSSLSISPRMVQRH